MAQTAGTIDTISVVSLKCQRCQKKETYEASHFPDDKEICEKFFPLWRVVGIDKSKDNICPMCRFKLFEIDAPENNKCIACGGKHYYETVRVNHAGRNVLKRCCCRMCDVNGNMIAKYSNRKKIFLSSYRRRKKLEEKRVRVSMKTTSLKIAARH